MSIPGTSASTSHGSQITNYARIGHAAQKIFPDILQELIAIKKPQHKLYGDIINNSYLSRYLRADEWLMINNVRANGYASFDIPLLYKLIRNLNLVSPPTQNWDYPASPTSSEILPGDDVERLRRMRNDILHKGNTTLPDQELAGYFQSFKDIAGRLETFLGKTRKEFVTQFEELEICCMDEKTQKEYLERLQKLSEREKKVEEVVANLRKDVDQIMNKDSFQVDIEQWEEQNKFFVKTKAVDYVLDILTEKANCTVIGSSGIGKSATIHHVALYLRDTEGYFIIPCDGPSDIKMFFVKEKKQVFVIDDVCGRYTAIQTEIEEWVKYSTSIGNILKSDNVKLLASCRLQVFNENQFQRLEYLVHNSCDLSTDTFLLSNEKKIQIALQYIPEDIVKSIKDDFDKYEFLPLMFALYRSLCGTNSTMDPKSYFRNPFEKYGEEIRALEKLYDKTKYCALFMLVINNGTIDASNFMSEELENKKKRRKQIFESCGISRSTLRERILEQLESLDNLFVKSERSWWSNTRIFTTIHDKLFDYLCFYFGMNMQSHFIKFSKVNVLVEHSHLPEYDFKLSKYSYVRNEDFLIVINKENDNIYFERMAGELLYGDYAAVLYSGHMKRKKFRLQLLKLFSILIADLDFMLDHIDRGRALLEKALEIGYYEFVKYVIAEGVNVNFTIRERDTPLILACRKNNNNGIIKLLIDKGANVNVAAKDNDTPLTMACTKNKDEVIKLLINTGADVNCVGWYGYTPLILSCSKCTSEIVKLLIDKGAKVNVANEVGNTPLISACRKNNDEIVKLLIDKGAKVNVANEAGNTPLISACRKNNDGIVKLLIDKGANVNVANEVGNTPLIPACRKNNDEIVKLLIDKGANVNVANEVGNTPLISACRKNNDEIVKLLIDKGANVNVANDVGDTPLILACRKNNGEIVKLLIDKGAAVNVANLIGDTPLFSACKEINYEIVKLLIDKGVNVNVANKVGDTPLILACRKNNDEIVKLLIDKGAAVNGANLKGDTPLLFACGCYYENYGEIVKLLINKGADVNYFNNGKTPLSLACSKKRHTIIKQLLEKGVDGTDLKGETPLNSEWWKNIDAIIRFLLDKGITVITGYNGDTPLTLACRNNDYEIVKLLIHKGENINYYGRCTNDTPLTVAIENRYNKIAKFLKDKGANVNRANCNGNTPLILSCEERNYEIIKLLIDKGADVDIANKGVTPISLVKLICRNNKGENVKVCIGKHVDVNVSLWGFDELRIPACNDNNHKIKTLLKDNYADLSIWMSVAPFICSCSDKKDEIVQLLKDTGACVNEVDNPFILACEYTDGDIVTSLLDKSSVVTLTDCNGANSLMLSCSNNTNDIVKLLIDKGASVNAVSHNDLTPLFIACANRNSEIVQILIQNGADINFANVNRYASLIKIYENKLDVMNTVLSIICIGLDCSDIAKVFLNNDVNVSVDSWYSYTPLICACASNSEEIVTLLIDAGADVNVVDCLGNTPLIWACRVNSKSVVRLLLDNNPDVNAIDNNGMSSLMFSCKMGNHVIVSWLLKAGASVSVKSHENKTVYSYAVESGDQKTIQIISDVNGSFTDSDTCSSTGIGIKRKQDSCVFDNEEIKKQYKNVVLKYKK